jgi:hypothetical protein
VRSAQDGSEHILALTNVTDSRQHLVVDLTKYQIDNKNWKDILSRITFSPRNGKLHIELAPYAIFWLKSSH